jgi:hypothetical protein
VALTYFRRFSEDGKSMRIFRGLVIRSSRRFGLASLHGRHI